jgi:glycosyltransferase involved in cell wall biosynthesis
MRILGVTDQTIDPPASGGAERIRCLYDRLARRHDVEVICLAGLREGRGVARVAPRLTFRKVPAPQRSLAHYLAVARIAPAFVSHYLNGLLAPLYAPVVRRPGWDVVQIDGIALGPFLRVVPRGIPVVYSAHNVEAEFQASSIAPLRFPAPFARAAAALERALLERADLIVAVSDRDRSMLASLYAVAESDVVVAPNGFDEDRFRPPTAEERARRRAELGFASDETVVLFAGSRVPHNEAAVRALVERIVPRLPWRCRLVVAGSVGGAFAWAANARLLVTGAVPDVVPYFHAADVAVNTVESGGGTNIKVLQYLAAGLPVVSTPFGMRGLQTLSRFVQTAEIDAMVGLLAAPAPRTAGLDAALSAFTWGASARRIESAYADLVARRTQSAAAAAAPARRDLS